MDSSTPASLKAVDAAIAEYNSLRSEITTMRTSQNASIGASITAIGIVVAYSSSAVERGTFLHSIPFHSIPFHSIPFHSAITILMYTSLSAQIQAASSYVRRELWPYIQASCDPTLPSGEIRALEDRRTERALGPSRVPGIAIGGFFYVSGIAFAIVTPGVPTIVNIGAAILVTVTIVVGGWLALAPRREAVRDS
jgi:hypothetical protein